MLPLFAGASAGCRFTLNVCASAPTVSKKVNEIVNTLQSTFKTHLPGRFERDCPLILQAICLPFCRCRFAPQEPNGPVHPPDRVPQVGTVFTDV